MRSKVRFLLGNHEICEIDQLDPTQTVLDWLRLHKRRTGTKEGCNEGDCGACTIVIASLKDGQLSYRAANSCIQFVGTLDGCQLLTVEDLKQDGRLHLVQQAMVDCHGSQCGFCTPGFVMSLYAMTKQYPTQPTEVQIDEILAGNLCRCTGYAPIVRAVHQIYAAGLPADPAADRVREQLAAWQDETTLKIGDGERTFYAPATEDDLARVLLDQPQATIVAGNTDVGLWVTKQMRRLDPVVSIGRVQSLKTIHETATTLEIGAGVTYSDGTARIAAFYPDFGDMLRRLGSTQIRNAGTIGGNIANGSPIGDATPAIIAMGATLHLRRGDQRRAMPIEDYFIAYGKQDRQQSEFVERISIPKPQSNLHYRVYKISKRFDQDISAVLGAFALTLDDGKINEARIAFGGMAATPKRASRTEAVLRGRVWDEEAVTAAIAAIAEDFTPISDMRASAAYRLKVAQNLLRRLYVETNGSGAETRLAGQEILVHA
ncbi:xanthine dehydrogenase small subunit [Methylovirgula sp. 4M-Z18]|uniref:xanthine dehydrogenase small subunit n=1 Tax=Methylovirgula sp. 4M-Z18 TaxID=2293567 RepID=UPI000E2EA1EF|nr:xanthine dehydrogenase small subunit [Methylovirgula sp. 4M-Z18]RFB80913.1 xanthine dehydrogenase small subunit [Methylovirgula sp. 4M-Z18]